MTNKVENFSYTPYKRYWEHSQTISKHLYDLFNKEKINYMEIVKFESTGFLLDSTIELLKDKADIEYMSPRIGVVLARETARKQSIDFIKNLEADLTMLVVDQRNPELSDKAVSATKLVVKRHSSKYALEVDKHFDNIINGCKSIALENSILSENFRKLTDMHEDLNSKYLKLTILRKEPWNKRLWKFLTRK